MRAITVAIALCLAALPVLGMMQTAEAQQSSVERLKQGDVTAVLGIFTELLPAIPQLLQWFVGVLAVILEGILAVVEVVVSFCLAPSGLPLLVTLILNGVFTAIGYALLGCLVGLPFCGVGALIATPIGAVVGFLRGIFGSGEVPEGMSVDLDKIRRWANKNPLEGLFS